MNIFHRSENTQNMFSELSGIKPEMNTKIPERQFKNPQIFLN